MKKTNEAARWWSEDRGFYMILLLCVLAVAVAAYVLFASPQTVEADPMDGYLYEADDSVSASEPLDRVPAMETEPAEDTDDSADAQAAEAAADTEQEKDEPAELTARDWRTHEGADYAGEEGDAVRAIADGTVLRVGDDTIYGKYVILSHTQDMNSLYAGLDNITVSEGDSVKGGDQLAELGSPMPLEQALGVHLHLAVTKEGNAVDPAGLF